MGKKRKRLSWSYKTMKRMVRDHLEVQVSSVKNLARIIRDRHPEYETAGSNESVVESFAKKELDWNWRKEEKRGRKGLAKTYKERNQFLREMGFSSYREYLASPLWAKIRARVPGYRCYRCGEPASQVHHRYYCKRNLSGETIAGLHKVCRRCHELLEFDANGSKLPQAAVCRKTKKVLLGNRGKKKSKKSRHQHRLAVPLEPSSD